MIGMAGNILITGGTGAIGSCLVRTALSAGWDCRLTVFSRSESRQAAMRERFPQVKYILGDVCNSDEVRSAVAGQDIVIHAAAMKRIPECQAQPALCFGINVQGTQNVADACRDYGVARAVFISTDKACRAITQYGASKLMGESIWRAAALQSEGAIYTDRATAFAAVRYGNVIGSTGSVLPLWKQQYMAGRPLTITDEGMTRFWMTEAEAVRAIVSASHPANHGCILVPKVKALPILDLLVALYGEDCPREVIGLRSLEKLHEDLVSSDEESIVLQDYFLLGHGGERGMAYMSNTAPRLIADDWLAADRQTAEAIV